jgi:hypothetical protein
MLLFVHVTNRLCLQNNGASQSGAHRMEGNSVRKVFMRRDIRGKAVDREMLLEQAVRSGKTVDLEIVAIGGMQRPIYKAKVLTADGPVPVLVRRLDGERPRLDPEIDDGVDSFVKVRVGRTRTMVRFSDSLGLTPGLGAAVTGMVTIDDHPLACCVEAITGVSLPDALSVLAGVPANHKNKTVADVERADCLVQTYLDSNPELCLAIESAIVERMYAGHADFNWWNYTLWETGQTWDVENIDHKSSFEPRTFLSWGFEGAIERSLTRRFAGKRLSDAVEGLVSWHLELFDCQQGFMALAQIGLTPNEIGATIARGKILVESGLPPVFEIATPAAEVYRPEREASDAFVVSLLKDPRFS